MRPPTTEPARFEIPSLDGLRALAVLLVVLSHVGWGHLVPGGLGVTVFFFLSGFLITTLMRREVAATGSLDVARFYLRRIARLYPPLLAAIAVAWLGTVAGLVPGGYSLTGLAAHLFYQANYFVLSPHPAGSIPDGTFVLWSLAVEEHFYIVYPIVFALLLPWRGTGRPVWLLVAGCLGALVWRIVWLDAGGDPAHIEFATDTRFDSLLFGCLLSLLMPSGSVDHERRSFSRRQSIALAIGVGLLLASVAIRAPFFRTTLRYTVQGIALMPIFFVAVRCPNAGVFRLLNLRAVRRVGTLSYSVYLIHQVLLAVMTQAGLDPSAPFARFALVAPLALGWALLIDRWIERPVRSLRARRAAGARPLIASTAA